jgi:endonuclease/exonuclease/phosphatase family metal-dependent hydrolase
MAQRMNGAILGATTFAVIGVLFLIAAIRGFTSSLYMSLYGNVANETVGAIALVVFAASLLAAIVAWRSSPRRSIALSATLLVGAAILATLVRWNWGGIVLWAVAVIGGTWWMALTHAARSRGRGSPFVLGLPIAVAADLALRAGFRTVPVSDQPLPLAVAVIALGALVFLAAGIAAYDDAMEWTSPGSRGALALAAIPATLLMGEMGATVPVTAAVAGGAALGPEGPGRWYLTAAAIGLAMTAGASAIDRPAASARLVGLVTLAAGSALFWARLPLIGTLGAVALAAGVIVAATLLPDTAARPARTPVLAVVALGVGWVAFVALAFLFYAYYALPAAAWIATVIVAVGLLAALPLQRPRFGAPGLVLVGLLAIAVPLGAFITSPGTTQLTRTGSFRLMTYNIHQGFDDGNTPSLDRIAEVIRAEDPDVVVLQEVARGWMITAQHDALTVLSERLAMQYVFGPAIGDAYGNAVLSRLPLSDVRYVSYPRQPQLRHQPRGAILLRVADVLLVATHLDHIGGATEVRQGQVYALLSAWNNERPALVVGDLNALPGSAEMSLLEGAGFRDLAKDDGADQPTSPAADPKNRIDYVWGIGVTGSQAHTVATTASDHRPLVMNISRR